MRGDGLRRGRALSPEKPHVRSGSLADISRADQGMSALSPEADMLIFDHHLNASYIYEQAIWPWDPLDRSVGG